MFDDLTLLILPVVPGSESKSRIICPQTPGPHRVWYQRSDFYIRMLNLNSHAYDARRNCPKLTSLRSKDVEPLHQGMQRHLSQVVMWSIYFYLRLASVATPSRLPKLVMECLWRSQCWLGTMPNEGTGFITKTLSKWYVMSSKRMLSSAFDKVVRDTGTYSLRDEQSKHFTGYYGLLDQLCTISESDPRSQAGCSSMMWITCYIRSGLVYKQVGWEWEVFHSRLGKMSVLECFNFPHEELILYGTTREALE